MSERDILFYSVLFLAVWFIWLWISQPKYEDGQYVTVMDRLRKVSKRVLCSRNKQRADDP